MIDLQIAKRHIRISEDTPVTALIPKEEKAMIYACIHNGRLQDLHYRLKEGGELSFVYKGSDIADMIYERTLSFLFISAAKQLYPQQEVWVEHALSNGLFCRLKGIRAEEAIASAILQRMKEIAGRPASIKKEWVKTEEAVAFFNAQGMEEKAELLKLRKREYSSLYTLEQASDYFYGILLPDTSYLRDVQLCAYEGGFWLSAQKKMEPQPKMFAVFQEFERWGRLIGASHIAQLNSRIQKGDMNELVLMSEAMMEKQLAALAERIVQGGKKVRFILIAGPSSAGKTTFSKRLAIHLKLLGKKPLALSMDDFFKDRKDTPRLPNGDYDFECVDALDIDYFQRCLHQLLRGETAQMPRFDFPSGKRKKAHYALKLEKETILIIEGIHGLNPRISAALEEDSLFRIYINALTHLNLDEHNRIPTADYRLIRRIARDHRFRGWSAAETIRLWKNVTDSEERYIYPYQEEADAVFNSSMIYELPLLKQIVVPLLKEIGPKQKEYLEANRICKLLEYFVDGASDAIPRNSIFAEFIGNSIFDVN